MKRLQYKDPDAALIAESVRILSQRGAVALIPTETVYGLVTAWDDSRGIDKIYELKDRDRSKLLAIFGCDAQALRDVGAVVDARTEKLLNRLCPGPVTLIVPSADGKTTIGFRIPDHPYVLALLKALPFPLASTSANLSGTPNVLCVDEALEALHGEVDLVVDAGKIPAGAQASTVIDLTGESFRILRPGPIGAEEIAEALR